MAPCFIDHKKRTWGIIRWSLMVTTIKWPFNFNFFRSLKFWPIFLYIKQDMTNIFWPILPHVFNIFLKFYVCRPPSPHFPQVFPQVFHFRRPQPPPPPFSWTTKKKELEVLTDGPLAQGVCEQTLSPWSKTEGRDIPRSLRIPSRCLRQRLEVWHQMEEVKW